MSHSASQISRPLPAGVEDAQNFHSVLTHPIRDDVGRTRNHQFASPLDAPCPAHGGWLASSCTARSIASTTRCVAA